MLKSVFLCQNLLKLASKHENKGKEVQGLPGGQVRIKADNINACFVKKVKPNKKAPLLF